MNPFEMVVAIVAVVMIASVFRARYACRSSSDSFRAGDDATTAENQRLRDELPGLKERLAVLERLATDDNTSSANLDREIEKLRDRT